MPVEIRIGWSGQTLGTSRIYVIGANDHFDTRPLWPREVQKNTARVQYTPRVISGSTTVLGALNGYTRLEAKSPAGTASVTKIMIEFIDPTTGRRIGGDNVITPVATTDYKLWSGVDSAGVGTGPELTGNAFVALSMTLKGAGAEIAFTNALAQAVYVQPLQVRGNTVEMQNSISYEKTSIVAGTDTSDKIPRLVIKDLPFGDNSVLAETYAQMLVNRYSEVFGELGEITFQDEYTYAGDNLLALGRGDVFKVTEAKTGFAGEPHAIVERAIEIAPLEPDCIRSIVFQLERITAKPAFTLNHAIYGKLNSGGGLAL